MPRKASNSSLTWCFTFNNYDEESERLLHERLREACSYYVVGREVGANGTRHLQGYIRLKASRSFESVKSECLNSQCHVEKARGAAGVNRRYCAKDGDFIEFGECPGVKTTKSRDDLAREFSGAIRSDGIAGLQRFSDDNPGVWLFSGHNLLRNYVTLQQPVERPEVHVEWIWGDPGVGKSRRAHERFPGAYIKEPRTKWWNGYLLQREVIIDDFGPNGIDLNHLLRWFDRYKCYVESKGGMIPLYADKFIVTSNFEPSDCFKDKDGVSHPQMDALYRRINIIKMD